MNFDLAETPTLQAVSAGDEHQLIEDLQQRVDAAVEQAEAQPEVISALETQKQAAARLEKLRQAERGLHQYAKNLLERLATVREAALDALIESLGDSGKPDIKGLTELGATEMRGRQVSQAIERLVEQRIPLAQIAALREESHALMSKVRALEQIARDRADRLLETLREAVSEEVVLPVDMSKGVSGALLHQASEYKLRAIQIAESADQIERAYMARTPQDAGRA